MLSVSVARWFALTLTDTLTARTAVISLAVASGWLVPVNFVLLVADLPFSLRTLEANIWLAACAMINFGMLGSAWWAWRLAFDASPQLDDMLKGSPDRERMEKWFSKCFSISRQATWSVFSAIVFVLLLKGASFALQGSLEIGIMSYLMVAWTSAIAFNILYWLATMCSIPLRMVSCRQLNLTWHEPANTPAIVKLCDGTKFVALAVGTGAISTEVLALAVPNKEGSGFLQGLSIVFPVFATVVALYTGAQPFYSVYLTVRRFKLEVLAQIDGEIGDLGRALQNLSLGKLELYRHISTSPDLPIRGTLIGQYAAAIVGSLAAYLLQRFLS